MTLRDKLAEAVYDVLEAHFIEEEEFYGVADAALFLFREHLLSDEVVEAGWQGFRDSTKPAPYNQIKDALTATAEKLTLNIHEIKKQSPKGGYYGKQ